jgi:hypothetical protein
MTSSITTSRAWLLLTFLLLPPLSPAATGVPPLPTLTVRVLPGTDPSVINDLANVRPVTGPAALQLDLAHKRILDAAGQIVVESDGSNPIHLQGTVDKWRYVQSLGVIAASHPLVMHIDFGNRPLRTPPSPPSFYNNELLSFVVTHVTAESQLVVFNLSSIGTIQLLHVREGKSGEDSGETVSVPAIVKSPFGVDHVVAVAATDPQRMHALIVWIAETARAHGMLDTEGAFLQQLMALRNVRVGVLVTYSCASAANCKR